MTPISVSEIFNEFKQTGLLTQSHGDLSVIIQRISPVESAIKGDLVFVDKPSFLETVQKQKPSCVVTTEKLKDLFTEISDISILVTPNTALAHAFIRQKYAGRDYSKSDWSKVHASAVIHESASIGSETVIEPNAVIGRNVKIGNNCRIMSGVVVEHDVTINDDSIVQPNCVIGYGTKIGKEVLIGSGSVIGSEGFGFAQDAKRKSFSIPQTGIVVIEDRVRLGANNCIDRATFHETRIGAGTKLDNLCHVAHNVQIGEDCLLTAMLCVAGSSKIGNRVITSGQTGILDHMTICDDTVFVHRAGVTKNIESPGVYAGLPLQPLQEYMKNSAVLKNATELKKRVQALEKQTEK